MPQINELSWLTVHSIFMVFLFLAFISMFFSCQKMVTFGKTINKLFKFKMLI